MNRVLPPIAVITAISLPLVATWQAFAAEPDPVAIEVTAEKGWAELSLDDEDSDPLLELRKREIYVGAERMSRSIMFRDLSGSHEIILQKNRTFGRSLLVKQISSRREMPEYIVVKGIPRPGGRVSYVYRPMSEKERIERKFAYGSGSEKLEALSEALRGAGIMTAAWAGVTDQQAGISDLTAFGGAFESTTRRDGASCEQFINSAVVEDGVRQYSQQPASAEFDNPGREIRDIGYSDSWVNGINLDTGKFFNLHIHDWPGLHVH